MIENIKFIVPTLNTYLILPKLINSLKACKAAMDTSKTLDQFVEHIIWIDCRLQGYSSTGVKSWWFRTKARAKYYKIGGLGAK